MNYVKYISSSAWVAKRKARLELDGHKCRLCDEDGKRFQLEVHHRPSSYEKIPNESVQDDLITVCSRCHDLITAAIREDRYGQRELKPTIVETISQIRQEIINHGMDTSNLSIDILGSAAPTQRANCGPAQQMVEIEKADLFQAKKDRRRSRRDCST